MEFDINSPSPKWIHPITDHHSVYTLSASSNEASLKCSHNIEFIGHRCAFNYSNDATPIDEFTFSILEWTVFVIHFNWIREITHAHSTYTGWYAIESMFNTIVIRLITNFYCDVRCIRIDFDSFQALSSLFSSITGSLPECVTPTMTTGDVKVGKFHETRHLSILIRGFDSICKCAEIRNVRQALNLNNGCCRVVPMGADDTPATTFFGVFAHPTSFKVFQ